MLENTIKNIIIKDITNTIKGKTTETVANNVKTIKNEVKDPSALLTENERVTLNKSKSDIVTIILQKCYKNITKLLTFFVKYNILI